MTPFVHEFYVNLRTGAAYERAKKPLSQGNALADKIVVHVQDCGKDVDLSGMGVSALVVRFDGQTVPLTGTIEEGAACITLDKDSYAVPGEARVTVMLSAGEMVQTVLVLLLNVDTSQTSIVVDNGTIGDFTDLLRAIAEMRSATADALEAAAEAKAAVDNIDVVLADAAPSIIVDASGAAVRITDGAERPAKSIVSIIEAVQSGEGDPSPDNVRPIIGIGSVNVNREGKNLFDLNAVESCPISDDTSNVRYGVKSMYRAGEYTISCKVNPGNTYIYAKIVKADGSLGDSMFLVTPSVVNKYTIDLAENEGLLVYIASGGATKESTINIFTAAKIQIEKGDTETVYEPYQQGVSLTTQFPQSVYGGSFNWNTGVLTVTHRGKALRAADISYKSDAVSVNTSCFVTSTDTSLAVGALTSMCSHFKNTWGDAYQASTARHGIFSDHATQTTKYFNWGEPDTTITEFQNWLEEQYAAGTPVTIVYLLKEPYTIQLTPQQLDLMKGYNYIWSDTGDMELEYTADTKIYIDNAIAAIAASIINV